MPERPLNPSASGTVRAAGRVLRESLPALAFLGPLLLWAVLSAIGVDSGSRDAVLEQILSTTPIVAGAIVLVLVLGLLATVIVRHVAGPLVLVRAEASGGVAAVGTRRLHRLLRWLDPDAPSPLLRTFVVVRPEPDHLVIATGEHESRIPWSRTRGVERHGSVLVLGVTRGARARLLTLRLVEGPGLLGLRRAPEETADRLHARLAQRIPAVGRPRPRAVWGSRRG
ncbi:hypothetical protein [Rathayibacter sp. Leaf296]|uniref:hypothetical protein n=1 Tax=Rathayibacter sp. Leaf296 TaxID=1736327 RepID=UPI000A75FFB8|nr:hypothetical protein [Rathayibacter sp. Leaf296]